MRSNDAKISSLSKALSFIPTCSNIDKARRKIELEAFGRVFGLNFRRDMFKPKSRFNPRNKDAAIELY